MTDNEPRIGQVRHYQKTRDVVESITGSPGLVDQWSEVYTARGWVNTVELAEATAEVDTLRAFALSRQTEFAEWLITRAEATR